MSQSANFVSFVQLSCAGLRMITNICNGASARNHAGADTQHARY